MKIDLLAGNVALAAGYKVPVKIEPIDFAGKPLGDVTIWVCYDGQEVTISATQTLPADSPARAIRIRTTEPVKIEIAPGPPKKKKKVRR